MTSAVGGRRGSLKSRQKGRVCVNSVCDNGGGGQKIRIFCGRLISIASMYGGFRLQIRYRMFTVVSNIASLPVT